jgi:putative membrane protein
MALKHLLAGVAAIGLMAQPALAQQQDTTGQQQQPPAQAGEQQQLAQEDMEFARKAAEGGLKEVRLGELAQQQAESEEVQQFGQRMVEDHGQANEQLKQIAEQKGIELPQELPDDAQQLHDELQEKSGAEFDQAYMDEMVSDHEEDVETFEDYVESAQDPDLRNFAEQTLPTLREHLELARQTQEQVVAAAGEMEQPDAAIEAEQEEAMEGAATTEAEQQAATQPQGEISIEEVLGSSVVNSAGEEIAEIEDIVLDENQEYYAILSVGGFLGIGDKKVAVPLDQLQLSEDKVYLMTAETEEQLEQMPEYDEDQYQPFQRG